MKILNINQYIKEKMKIMPITNDEFDKAGGFHYEMDEVKNIKYNDLLDTGNIICIESSGTTTKQYHGITMKISDIDRISGLKNHESDEYEYVIATLDKKDTLSYWNCEYFKSKFPYNKLFTNLGKIYISKIFNTNIDVSKLTKEKIKEIYKELGLTRY